MQEKSYGAPVREALSLFQSSLLVVVVVVLTLPNFAKVSLGKLRAIEKGSRRKE